MAANANLGQSVWNADDIINPVTTLRSVGVATIDLSRVGDKCALLRIYDTIR